MTTADVLLQVSGLKQTIGSNFTFYLTVQLSWLELAASLKTRLRLHVTHSDTFLSPHFSLYDSPYERDECRCPVCWSRFWAISWQGASTTLLPNISVHACTRVMHYSRTPSATTLPITGNYPWWPSNYLCSSNHSSHLTVIYKNQRLVKD